MRVVAAAFALALGFMSPTSAVSSPTKWTEVELFAVVVELAGAEQVCKTSLKVDLLTLGRLDYIAEDASGTKFTPTRT